MRHRLLGQSGLRVSEIGLGTLNFGETKAWGVAEPEARAILETFLERGGSLIDTAPNYAGGAAEELLGRLLAPHRDRVVLATKYTAHPDRHPLAGGNSARTMQRSVEASLRRLGTDRIDLLWLHYWDGTAPLAEILKAAEHLTSQGKIGYFAFSDTPAWLVARAMTMADLRGWSVPVAIQCELNLAARSAERELLPMADALGLGVVAWGPLAAGALVAQAPERRPAAALPEPLREIAGAVRALAAEAGLSPLALALGWLRARQAPVVVPLLGARMAAQLATALDAAETVPDPELLARLDALAPPVPGFPHELIASPYLRRLALGDPAQVMPPERPRA